MGSEMCIRDRFIRVRKFHQASWRRRVVAFDAIDVGYRDSALRLCNGLGSDRCGVGYVGVAARGGVGVFDGGTGNQPDNDGRDSKAIRVASPRGLLGDIGRREFRVGVFV